MREALLGELLLILVELPTEELGGMLAELRRRVGARGLQGAGADGGGERGPCGQAGAAGGSGWFALRRGDGAWLLTYDGERVVFVDRAGMDWVDYLLKHPHEPMHPVALVARVKREAELQQRSSALDDAEATRRHLREMERLRGVIESDEASEADKERAEEELAELEGSTAGIHHRTRDGAARAAKRVRQAIRRVCETLAEARDEHGRPHPVLTAFAGHVRAHLLGASQTGSDGHLVYEPPPGVVWE